MSSFFYVFLKDTFSLHCVRRKTTKGKAVYGFLNRRHCSVTSSLAGLLLGKAALVPCPAGGVLKGGRGRGAPGVFGVLVQ